jgi:prohibitin 1
MKATVAQYNAESLLTQREMVSREIREAITNRARQFNILMDDVSITHLVYGKEYARAIEEKQVAEQEAERQKYVVAKSEFDQQATIIRAEGEAEAAQMISDTLREHGSGLIEVRRIDAARDIAEQLAKSPNVMYLPHGQQMLLNVGSGGSQRPAQQ